MPDHFDRLARRSTPDAAGVPRVRPRLPGPFERIDAPGTEPQPFHSEHTAAAPNRPTGPTLPRDPSPAEHRRTDPPATLRVVQLPSVVRELAVPDRGVLTAPAVPPPLRPGLRPAAPHAEAGRAAPRAERPPTELTKRQTTLSVVRSAAEPPPAARSAAPARASARAAAAAEPRGHGRQPRPPERVVHVSIGRLEVRAAERRPDPDRRGERAERPARPVPSLSLHTYLSREEAPR